MFVMMGIMLECSWIVDELLIKMVNVFGFLLGGLVVLIVVVGVFFVVLIGIVGVIVVIMGLLVLLIMLKNNYLFELVIGVIVVFGILG